MSKTPTFEEMFGVGKVPIASYFGLPKGASADTRFAPEARALLSQGEEYAREQAARDAEIAAEELLGGAADMTDADIQQQLLRSPKMFGTKAIQPLSGFMQYRQSMTPVSDETLGPVFREKITDPYHRERFDKRMLEEGLSANDAFDAYRTDEYNNKFEVALAEAGVPETEYAKLKTPSGKFIPGAVARAKQTAEMKAEEAKQALTRKVSDDPLDKKIDAYERAMEQREKIFKATGREAELAKDQTYLGYITKLEEANKAKFAVVDPSPKAKVTPLPDEPEGPITPVGTDARPLPPELEQHRQAIEAKKQEEQIVADQESQKAAQVVEQEWTKQKMGLEDRLREFYPKVQTGEDPLIAVAYGIIDNPYTPDADKKDMVRYRDLIKRRLGIKDVGEKAIAFKEPLNERWGPQEVTFNELLKVWAEQVVAGNEARKPQKASTPQKSSDKDVEVEQVE